VKFRNGKIEAKPGWR